MGIRFFAYTLKKGVLQKVLWIDFQDRFHPVNLLHRLRLFSNSSNRVCVCNGACVSHRAAIVFFSDDVAQSVFAVTQGVLVSPPIALHALRHVPLQLLGKTSGPPCHSDCMNWPATQTAKHHGRAGGVLDLSQVSVWEYETRFHRWISWVGYALFPGLYSQ